MRELREAVWERQQGRCAATGLPLDWDRDDLHHRLPGGMGGSSVNRDRLSNLVGLVAAAHNMGSPRLPVDGMRGRSVHTDPRWSRSVGLLLSAGQDPAEMPVRVGGLWLFLTDDGGVLPLAGG